MTVCRKIYSRWDYLGELRVILGTCMKPGCVWAHRARLGRMPTTLFNKQQRPKPPLGSLLHSLSPPGHKTRLPTPNGAKEWKITWAHTTAGSLGQTIRCASPHNNPQIADPALLSLALVVEYCWCYVQRQRFCTQGSVPCVQNLMVVGEFIRY